MKKIIHTATVSALTILLSGCSVYIGKSDPIPATTSTALFFLPKNLPQIKEKPSPYILYYPQTGTYQTCPAGYDEPLPRMPSEFLADIE
jgi:PBP1b-binding outer membrane lipoprotein LpoB